MALCQGAILSPRTTCLVLALFVTVSQAAGLQSGLHLAMPPSLSRVFEDHGSGAALDMTAWNPNLLDGYSMLFGSYIQPNYNQPGTFDGWAQPYGPPKLAEEVSTVPPFQSTPTLSTALRASAPRPILQRVSTFTKVWSATYEQAISVWEANAPEGYVSIGNVVTNGSSPNGMNVMAVAQECTVPCEPTAAFWESNDASIAVYGAKENSTVIGGAQALFTTPSATGPMMTCLNPACLAVGAPEQIHIAYGKPETSTIEVTWNTIDSIGSAVPRVTFFKTSEGADSATTVVGTSSSFVDGGSQHRTIYVHRVTLSNLSPNTSYTYSCGASGGSNPDRLGWSAPQTFVTMAEGTDWVPRFAVYGDLGLVNDVSLPNLRKEVAAGHFDMVLHVGDFAYDLHTSNARVGDAWMNDVQPIASKLPYMVCPGNHEASYNFSNYMNRFSMPNYETTQNLYYSWNVANAHIVSLSSEAYFYDSMTSTIPGQLAWLKADLAQANAERHLRPWLIVMAHRPFYCTNADHDDCAPGSPGTFRHALETLLYDAGVDLGIWAHEHSYERMFPVYNNVVMNGSISEPYTNPNAPVYIVTGSAGCSEDHNSFGKSAPWSAFHSTDYGYSRMTIFNDTHLYLDYVSDDQGGSVIDRIWLVKDTHGPYHRSA